MLLLRYLPVVAALSAAAAATSAPLGRSPATPQGLIIDGTIAEGDAPNDFHEAIDLRTGFDRNREQMGDSERYYGFDGSPWDAGNGIVTVSNLPAAVQRGATFAWLDARAWRERMAVGGSTTRRIVVPHGFPVELEFDPATRLLQQATVAEDWGSTVVTFSDWRRAGPFIYPFHRDQLTADGERTVVQVQSAKVVNSLPKASLSRPRAQPHAVPLPQGVASVMFQATGRKSTHILVDAKINNQPTSVIFDTGAADYLNSEDAPKFGVTPTGGVNIGGVGESSSTGGYARIGRVALGDAALRDEIFVVGPSPFPPPKPGAPPNPVGFTGFEFFAEYVTTIDYPARKLRFAATLPAAKNAIQVPFWNDGSHIYVKARVNGVEGLFGLDTGDGGTVMIFPEFAKRHGLEKQAGALTSDGGGVGGAVKATPGVADRFSLAGLDFDQLPVEFSHQKAGAFASKSLAGNLGGGILQCYSITIDFAHRLLLFEPAPGNPYCKPGGTVSRS